MHSISLRCVVILESPFIARKTTTQLHAVEDVHVNRDAGRGSTYYDFVTFQQLDSKFYLNLDIDGWMLVFIAGNAFRNNSLKFIPYLSCAKLQWYLKQRKSQTDMHSFKNESEITHISTEVWKSITFQWKNK